MNNEVCNYTQTLFRRTAQLLLLIRLRCGQSRNSDSILRMRKKKFFLSPDSPNQFWGPFSFLFKRFLTQNSRGVELTTHFQRIPRLRMRGAMPHILSIYLHYVQRENFTFLLYILFCIRKVQIASTTIRDILFVGLLQQRY
jgi:hypothetical protein